jgi:hypothetical protein
MLRKKECDFIVKQGRNVSKAIQVCHSLKDAATRKRETDGLLEAMAEFRLKNGYILTYDENDTVDMKEGKIEILPVWQWLLRQDSA